MNRKARTPIVRESVVVALMRKGWDLTMEPGIVPTQAHLSPPAAGARGPFRRVAAGTFKALRDARKIAPEGKHPVCHWRVRFAEVRP